VPARLAYAYVAVWGALVALAIGVAVRRRASLDLDGYLRHLGAPWRLVTFAVAAGFFVFAAPYVGDPTWDRVDGALMSGLTYATAPWAVGSLFRVARRLGPPAGRGARAFVAVVAWLLSASWCYDGWLFWRDGRYPRTWSSNLLASSVLYACAGLFFSLTIEPGRGVVFAFMRARWWQETRGAKGAWKLAVMAALIALVVVGVGVPFVLQAAR